MKSLNVFIRISLNTLSVSVSLSQLAVLRFESTCSKSLVQDILVTKCVVGHGCCTSLLTCLFTYLFLPGPSPLYQSDMRGEVGDWCCVVPVTKSRNKWLGEKGTRSRLNGRTPFEGCSSPTRTPTPCQVSGHVLSSENPGRGLGDGRVFGPETGRSGQDRGWRRGRTGFRSTSCKNL